MLTCFVYAQDGSDLISEQVLNDPFNKNIFKFTENKKQWHPNVRFKAETKMGNVYLENTGITYDFLQLDHSHHSESKTSGVHKDTESATYQRHVVRVNFLNSLPSPSITGDQKLSDYNNYYKGNDPSKWASNVSSYYKINYKQLYKGIDLSFYNGKNYHLKYDFIVAPNANPNQIQLEYNGAKRLKIDRNGNLIVYTKFAPFVEGKPYVYQIHEGNKIEVPSAYQLKGNILSFQFPQGYQKELPLIIDPQLVFSRSIGSVAPTFGMTATPGENGEFYAGGVTFGNEYPTSTGAYDGSFSAETDVVVTKYSDDGSQILFSTFLGGMFSETVHSMIEKNGFLYIYGVTGSSDFPTSTGAFDTTFAGGQRPFQPFIYLSAPYGTDMYVAKFPVNGQSLSASTLIGGNSDDGVNMNASSYSLNPDFNLAYDTILTTYGDQFRGEIMVDEAGDCYVASCTRSADFPTKNAFQGTIGGNQDGVIFKFNTNLTRLEWSSFVGGSNNDALYSVKIDNNNNVITSGGTSSPDISLPGTGLTKTFVGGKADAIIYKIAPTGNTVIASTILGTPSYDQAYFVELNEENDVFVTGQSQGKFPIIGNVFNKPGSQFIAKLNPELTNIDFSTTFGNGSPASIAITPTAFLVDECENIYISGWGDRSLHSLPITADAIKSEGDNTDRANFYLIVLSKNAKYLRYGSYFGGNASDEHVDGGTSRFDKQGIVYQSVCSGCSSNTDFPSTFPNDPSSYNLSDGCNIGVFKYDFQVAPLEEAKIIDKALCQGGELELKNLKNGLVPFYWLMDNGDSLIDPIHQKVSYDVPGTYLSTLMLEDTLCERWDTIRYNVYVTPEVTLDLFTDTLFCDIVNHQLEAFTNGKDSILEWSTSPSFNSLLDTLDTRYRIETTPKDELTLYVRASNAGCKVVKQAKVNYSYVTFPEDQTMCPGNELTLYANQHYKNDPIKAITWTPQSTFKSEFQNNPAIIHPEQSETISASVLTTKGCSYNGNFFLTVPVLDLELEDEYFYCDSNQHTISLEDNGTATSIHWSTSINFDDTLNNFPLGKSIDIIADSDRYYYARLKNSICTRIDSALVGSNFLEFPEELKICAYDTAYFTLNFLNELDDVKSIRWEPDNKVLEGQGTPTIALEIGLKAQFNVQVETKHCTFDQFSEIETFPKPEAKFSLNKDIIDDYEVFIEFTNLSSTDALGGEWNLGDGNTMAYDSKQIDFTHLYQDFDVSADSLEISLIVSNNFACSDTAIQTLPIELPIRFYVPNTFSPNGDGVNDFFFGKGVGVEQIEMRIFNRWGDNIYISKDLSSKWDGMDQKIVQGEVKGNYSPNLSQVDAYVYKIDVWDIKGRKETFRGVVHLIR